MSWQGTLFLKVEAFVEGVFAVYEIDTLVCGSDSIITNLNTSHALFNVTHRKELLTDSNLTFSDVQSLFSVQSGSLSLNTCPITSILIYSDALATVEVASDQGIAVYDSNEVTVDVQGHSFDPERTFYMKVSSFQTSIVEPLTVWIIDCSD